MRVPTRFTRLEHALLFTAVSLFCCAALLSCSSEVNRDESGQITATVVPTEAPTLSPVQSGNVFELEVGDCFDDSTDFVGDGLVSDVEIVDCSEAHDNEVYLLFDMPDGEFPGESVVETAAGETCLKAFGPFVGMDYESSILDFGWFRPTADYWDEGDRTVVCFVYDFNLKKLTGSARGSGE